MDHPATELTEPTESQPSPSLPSPPSSPPWWRAPERVIAVTGAIALCWIGRLSPQMATTVLVAALGAPATRTVMRAFRRLRGK